MAVDASNCPAIAFTARSLVVSSRAMLSEKEQADIDKIKLEQGIKNKVDLMIEENPDLDRKQALELLMEKMKENIELMRESMNNGLMDGTDEDTEDDQIEPKRDQEE